MSFTDKLMSDSITDSEELEGYGSEHGENAVIVKRSRKAR